MREADNLTTFMCRMSWKYGSLNLLEPSGPHRDGYGTAFPFLFLQLQCSGNKGGEKHLVQAGTKIGQREAEVMTSRLKYVCVCVCVCVCVYIYTG